jgi:hypothetical protein
VKYNEFFAIFAEAKSNDLEILFNDEDGYEDIISYIDGSDGWMFDEVWVLPYTDIEKPSTFSCKRGTLMSTVRYRSGTVGDRSR